MQNHKVSKKQEYIWWVRVYCATHFDDWLKDCFEGLTINQQEDGTTILTGELPDMSAVYGLFSHLSDKGIMILCLQVERILGEGLCE